VNFCLRLWLTCLLLSACCCCRLYWLQISGVSLTLTWPHRLCLLRVLLGTATTATSFPLSKHTGGGGATPAFSGLCVYLQFRWEVGLPSSPVEFSSHHHFYKLSCSWLLGRCCCSCLLQPDCLFIVLWGIAPSPLFGAQGALPSLLRVFFIVIVYYSVCFFLFSLGGGQSAQGAMLIWPRVVCGSTECRLAHLVVCFSQAG
jgi:hypothetical protein